MARALTLLPLLLALCAAAWGQGFHPGDAARVNGVPISNQRFNGFYIEYRNSKGVAVGARGDQLELLKRLRREALDGVIEQELVSQAAERRGVQVDAAEVDAAMAELKSVFEDPKGFEFRLQSEGFSDEQSYRRHVERMLAAKKYLDAVRGSNATVSDEELEAYYRDNERRLTFPEQVRVRHILLTWKPLGTKDDRAALREQMAAILERARAGEDFAALAREYSDDSATKESGGDTGFFHRGQMVPAFENAAFSLAPGEISEPVETVFGVHIIRLEERQAPRLVPLEEVREPLREHVAEEKMTRAVKQEIERLRAEAEIEILIPLEKKASY